jgi:hypothetical protein
MLLGKAFSVFVEKSPISVMVCGTVERICAAHRSAQVQEAQAWPKTKQPKKTSGKRIHHVSTARILAMRT